MQSAKRDPSFTNERIYDIGMHNGQDTAFYLKKGFTVVAIEANPLLVARAASRFRRFIERGQLHVEAAGIAEYPKAESLKFYVNQRVSEWSSFDRALAERGSSPVSEVSVATTTLSALLDKFGPAYYVKIDIEGLDRAALASLLASRHRPRYVSVENGHQGMLRMLTDAGYDSFKYVQQRHLSRLRLPQPAGEGRDIVHQFPRGCSGPFGEEAPGEWQSAAEMKDIIGRYWDVEGSSAKPSHSERVNGWFDLHARYPT